MNVFITGVSSGIGKALASSYAASGWSVYGVSRRTPDGLTDRIHFTSCDLTDVNAVGTALTELLGDVDQLDLVILNAGMLGELADMSETDIEDLTRLMDVNVWANKTVLDWLFSNIPTVKQVVAISSGAAVNGSRGWNGYSISKAALNMLVKLYSRERSETHFCALAPGLVDTAMQDYLCSHEPDQRFPSLEKLKGARGTETMPSPVAFAEKAIPTIASLPKYESGTFIDIRKM